MQLSNQTPNFLCNASCTICIELKKHTISETLIEISYLSDVQYNML